MMVPTAHPLTRHTLEEAIRDVYQRAGISRTQRGSEDVEPRSLAIGVTSPRPADGKSTVAIGLATSLAEDHGCEVMLVDADFHSHSIEWEYGLEGQAGLIEVFEGQATVDDVTHHIPGSTLRVMVAGMAHVDPARSARSEQARQQVENMKASNRYVVFDLPATLETTAPVVAGLCDAVIVVVRAGETTREQVERALRRLDGTNVLGVVVNRWSTRIPRWVEKSPGLKA